jgi:hypothetical protein
MTFQLLRVLCLAHLLVTPGIQGTTKNLFLMRKFSDTVSSAGTAHVAININVARVRANHANLMTTLQNLERIHTKDHMYLRKDKNGRYQYFEENTKPYYEARNRHLDRIDEKIKKIEAPSKQVCNAPPPPPLPQRISDCNLRFFLFS